MPTDSHFSVLPAHEAGKSRRGLSLNDQIKVAQDQSNLAGFAAPRAVSAGQGASHQGSRAFV